MHRVRRNVKKDDDLENGSRRLLNRDSDSSQYHSPRQEKATSQVGELSSHAKLLWIAFLSTLIIINLILIDENKEILHLMRQKVEFEDLSKISVTLTETGSLVQLSEQRDHDNAERKKLQTQVEQTTKLLDSEKDSLIKQLSEANTELKGNDTFVHVDHHEAEIGARDKTISNLETEIHKTRNTLDLLKTAAAEFDNKTIAGFCDKCKGNFNGLRITCGERMKYLVDKHKMTEKDAKASVIETDINCTKD